MPRAFFSLLNGGELAIIYRFVFLYFWLAGGGEWSLRSIARAHISIRPIGEPGLGIMGYIMPQFGRSCATWCDVAAFHLLARIG